MNYPLVEAESTTEEAIEMLNNEMIFREASMTTCILASNDPVVSNASEEVLTSPEKSIWSPSGTSKAVGLHCNKESDIFPFTPQIIQYYREQASKDTGHLLQPTSVKQTESKGHERQNKERARRRHSEPKVRHQAKIVALQTRNKTEEQNRTKTGAPRRPRRKAQRKGSKSTPSPKVRHLQEKFSVCSNFPLFRFRKLSCSYLHESTLASKTLWTNCKKRQVRQWKHRWRRKRSLDGGRLMHGNLKSSQEKDTYGRTESFYSAKNVIENCGP